MISRPSLRTLLHFPSRRAAIASGAWGAIVDGTGWHEVEYRDGRPFRWAEEGAQIELASSTNTWLALDMDVEPGPSLGNLPLHLELCDQMGKCVACVDAAGRQVAHLGLPVSPLSPTVYTLHVPGNSHPVPGDSRRLSFRVFALRESAPLLSPMLRFESCWHAYEKHEGRVFRWADNGAAIEVQAPRGFPILKADLEPGPGTLQRPFRIDLLTVGGERIFTTSIRTREQIYARLPLEVGEVGVFRFSADESMVARAPGDSRNLIFRTFGMAIG